MNLLDRPPLSKELWFSEDPNVANTLVFKDVSSKGFDIWSNGQY